MRAAAEPPEQPRSREANRIKECISSGELVPLELVMKYVEANISMNLMAPGIILDGFPRDMQQVTEFEAKVRRLFHLFSSAQIEIFDTHFITVAVQTKTNNRITRLQ